MRFRRQREQGLTTEKNFEVEKILKKIMISKKNCQVKKIVLVVEKKKS